MATGSTPIWNKAARDYEKYVTHSTNHFLKQYLRKEREFIKETIQEAAKTTGKKVTVFEVGSGTGRVAFDIADNRDLDPFIKYIIGIDSAEEMVNQAIKLQLEKLRWNPNDPELSKRFSKIFFSVMDALDLSNYIQDGKISQNGSLPGLEKINRDIFNQSVKVVILALNTLGVFRSTSRPDLLNDMRSIAGFDGYVIISVFSAKDFKYCAGKIYRSMLPLVEATKKADLIFGRTKELDKSIYIFRSKTGDYWSEWFTKEAFDKLIRNIGQAEKTQAVLDEETKREIALISAARPKKI